MPKQTFSSLAGFAIALLALSSLAAARSEDRFQMNRTLQIEATDHAGDVTCFHCSVYVRGEVRGDVTTIGGSVIVQDGGVVRGDVSSIAGDVRLSAKANIAGDVSSIAGDVRRDPHATIGGDVSSLSGGIWLVLIFGVPLALLGALIALITWLFRRSRAPVPAAAM